jgi:hypothetical protein
MTFQESMKWAAWLPMAEWWYNTSFHTSLKCTPFEAVYGYPPPQISEIMISRPESTAYEFLQQKQTMIAKPKENLAQSQARIKKFADKNRSERKFELGDLVYLKLQPYRHSALNLHNNLKLSTMHWSSCI